ncbi:MAG: class I adenylate-forming enzyme family protein [Pseudonocardiaceae bacterium]
MTTPMTTQWTSANGIVLGDLVPAPLRRRWVERGYCSDQDLYTLFSEHVRARPQQTAVIDAAGAIDYATLDTRVRRIAAALAEAGLGPHDIIGIQVPNGWRAVAAELAVAAVGAVALPYPAGRGRRDSVSLLGRSRASAAIVADVAGQVPLAANLAAQRRALPDLRTVFVFGATPDGCEPLDRWLAGDNAAGRRRWHPVPVDPEAPARILVTSGSEAEPKMIAYSHNAMGGGRGNYIGALHDGSDPMRNLILVPLASSYGSCGTSVTLARHGGAVLLLDAFDPAAALRMITDHRPTHVFGVPTMLRRMADLPRTPGEDLSSLRAVVTSSSLLHTATTQACRARFGAPVINIYGSADGINCHTAGGSCGSEACVGRPDPTVAEIRITDAAGQPVPAGQDGEIWAFGPMTPLCYVNAPELDARYRPPGGWVRSGDRGLLDQDGCLHYVDRLKQVVIRGGYNISPAEVERQINVHPVIADAACVAVADTDLGERLCVCVVQRPGTAPLALTELNAFLEGERGLERKKLPELLVALAELPLGATGKLCRQTLTRLAAAAQGCSAQP